MGLEEEEVVGSVAVEAGGDESHLCVYTHDSFSMPLYITALLCTEIIKGKYSETNYVNIIYHVHIYSSITVIYIFVNKQIICITILLIISL